MKTPAELRKQLNESISEVKSLLVDIEDSYEERLVESIYHNRNWRRMESLFETVIKESESFKSEQKELSIKSVEVEKALSLTKFYQQEAIKLSSQVKQFVKDYKLTTSVLYKYGFEFKNQDYVKVIHNEDSEEGYTTLRLFQKDDHFICYLSSITLYTLNDLKMLWFLLTREELTEVI